MKRASEVPPPVESEGLRPVTSSTARATRSVNGPGLVRNATALVGSKVERRAPAAVRRRDPALDLGGERFGRPEIVEADVELEAHFARNDVEGRIADVDRDHFEVGRLEVGVAGIERRREQRRQYRAQAPGLGLSAICG